MELEELKSNVKTRPEMGLQYVRNSIHAKSPSTQASKGRRRKARNQRKKNRRLFSLFLRAQKLRARPINASRVRQRVTLIPPLLPLALALLLLRAPFCGQGKDEEDFGAVYTS